MNRLLCLLVLAAGSLVLLAGCGGAEKDKGRFRDKDRPRSTDKVSMLRPAAP